MPPRSPSRRVTLVSGLLLAGVSATTGAIVAQPWSAMADHGVSDASPTTAPVVDPPIAAGEPPPSGSEHPSERPGNRSGTEPDEAGEVPPGDAERPPQEGGGDPEPEQEGGKDSEPEQEKGKDPQPEAEKGKDAEPEAEERPAPRSSGGQRDHAPERTSEPQDHRRPQSESTSSPSTKTAPEKSRAKPSGSAETAAPAPDPAKSDPPAPAKSDPPSPARSDPPAADPSPTPAQSTAAAEPKPSHTGGPGPAPREETSHPTATPTTGREHATSRPATPRPTSKPAPPKEKGKDDARTAPSPTTGATATSAPRAPLPVQEPAPPKPAAPAETVRPAASPSATLVPDTLTEQPTEVPEALQPPEAWPSSSPPARAVLPVPPLARVSAMDSCGTQDPLCWSLAPWRSRTLEPSAAVPPAAMQVAPLWAFAPPPTRPTLAPNASSWWAPAPVRAGCWSFSPSALCAKSWEQQS